MKDTITLNKVAFATLVTSMYKPNPEDWRGPRLPWPPPRPWWLDLLGHYRFDPGRIGINPQPIPPGDFNPGGPHPQPWHATAAVLAGIEHARQQLDLAAIVAGGEASRGAVDAIGKRLSVLVDDLCPPWRIPFPWPRPNPGPWPPDLFAAAAELQLAARHDGPLQGVLQAAADRMLQGALAHLDAQLRPEPAHAVAVRESIGWPRLESIVWPRSP